MYIYICVNLFILLLQLSFTKLVSNIKTQSALEFHNIALHAIFI